MLQSNKVKNPISTHICTECLLSPRRSSRYQDRKWLLSSQKDEFRFSHFRRQRSYLEGAYGHHCICFLIIPWVCDFSFNIELSDIILAKFRLCKNTFNASTSNYNWIFLKVNYYHTDWYFQDVTSIKLWQEMFVLNIFTF